MKTPIPDFPPLSPRQWDLLEKIKSEKEKLTNLNTPESDQGISELEKILNAIDKFTVSLTRSGAILRGPDKSFSFPPEAHAWAKKKGLDKPQIQHYYHPELPTWAISHLEDWIQRQRLRGKEGRKTLRKTKVEGLETGMKRPWDMAFLIRVLELRGFVIEDDQLAAAMEDEPSLNTLKDILERSRMVVTDEMLENVKRQEGNAREKKRTRKERNPWHKVIKILVNERWLPKKISPQAFKEMLKQRYPSWPWGKV
ncbi:MAG: hypothetical protein FJ134_00330 [Deltaproteobacteria bacterium]|nr:hypothetical protein [Deltaproteobacteria bacterium]